MQLLDEGDQKWYCYRDDEIFYSREAKWGTPLGEAEAPDSWTCLCGRKRSASYSFAKRIECIDCEEPHYIGVRIDSTVVQEVKRRFRANMRGAYGYPDKKIDKIIASAEAASSPTRVVAYLEKTDAAIFASKAPGWFGIGLGSFAAMALNAIEVARLKPPVPLFGTLTQELEHLTSKRLGETTARLGTGVIVQEVEPKASTKFCRECGERIPRDSVFCEECGAKIA